jgi:hypothetical protein
MPKKLSHKIIAAVVAILILYVAYYYWGISIIKANMRKNAAMVDFIKQKAEENETDFETQLADDAKWNFQQTGFQWYN